jgi:nucleoside-diphosphate kinase
MMERTFAIIKPDAVDGGHIGDVIAMIEKSGLKPVALKLLHLSKAQAEGFYGVHRGKKFFKDLIKYITSGPVVAMILEGDNAIDRWRKLMGPTNAADAPKNTIRGKFGKDIEENAVHGSDAPETAAVEIAYFFNAFEFITPGRK